MEKFSNSGERDLAGATAPPLGPTPTPPSAAASPTTPTEPPTL
jgi:hypothetical protein